MKYTKKEIIDFIKIQHENDLESLINFLGMALSDEEPLKIGDLRQWLNENRITDPKKMVTDEEIKQMLGI